MSKMNLNALRDRAYKTACEHGFHDAELGNEHYLMLVVTELSEAVEADRKANYCSSKISSTERYNLFPTEENRFENEFRGFVKDTVEEELSDAFIRLLDLYGLLKIGLDEEVFSDDTIQAYSETYQSKSFTESVYYIIGQLASVRYSIKQSSVLPEMLLLEILGFARHLGIDLFWFIEQKMKYNELREKMHGKKY